jgi:hypothetical protein
MEKFTKEIRMISELSHQRARLVASASVEDGRVTVTVNADGAIIETRFSDRIDDLNYDTVARAVTSAAQQAFREVGRLGRELMAPVAAHHATMPRLHDLIPGLPDLRDQIPELPEVSLAPPAERRTPDGTADLPRAGKPAITETDW